MKLTWAFFIAFFIHNGRSLYLNEDVPQVILQPRLTPAVPQQPAEIPQQQPPAQNPQQPPVGIIEETTQTAQTTPEVPTETTEQVTQEVPTETTEQVTQEQPAETSEGPGTTEESDVTEATEEPEDPETTEEPEDPETTEGPEDDDPETTTQGSSTITLSLLAMVTAAIGHAAF